MIISKSDSDCDCDSDSETSILYNDTSSDENSVILLCILYFVYIITAKG